MIKVRSLLVVPLLGLAALFAQPGAAAAHPLGNFTINHYSLIVVSDGRISLRWVLDMAEIPAFAARRQIDADRNGTLDRREQDAWLDATLPGLLAQLDLRVDGTPFSLSTVDRQLSFPAGQGGLSTLRLVVDLDASGIAPRGTITYADLTFPERIGWHEIVAAPDDGVRLSSSNVPFAGVSDELRHYPPDALTNPVNVTSATVIFDRAPGAAGSVASSSSAAPGAGGRPTDPLADLVSGNLTLAGGALAVLLAIALGAAHAVSPGHGKTLVAAYLIGSRGSLAQAMWLGITVAVTHTIGVFALGAVTLVATEVLVPERLITWLSLGSGLLVIGLGGSLLWRAWRARSHAGRHLHGHEHEHEHGHGHGHEHGLEHEHTGTAVRGGGSPAIAPPLSRAGIAALGLVGGMVPSASALLVLLVAITTGRIVLGLALILAFGLGMAMVLAAVSASVVLVRRRADIGGAHWTRHALVLRVGRLIPVASALLVLAIGFALSIGAARALG